MTPIHRTLVAARALIARPGSLSRGWIARANRGQRVDADDGRAVRFDIVGAVAAAVARDRTLTLIPTLKALELATGVKGGSALQEWSDRNSHALILAAFDRAIMVAEVVAA